MEQAGLVISKRIFPWRWGVILAVSLFFLGWLLNTPEGLLGKADAVGYAVCHRIDLRSFHLGDRVLPLCARCTGMYLGALVGLVYQAVIGKRRIGMPPRSVILLLVALVGFFLLDGGNSFFALIFGRGLLYTPNNMLRLFSGTGMGLVIATALLPAFNQTIWQDCEEAPLVSGIRSFLVVLLLVGLVDWLVLTKNPQILYIFALLSSLGVLVLLTMLFTMILVMVLRRENVFTRFSQLPVYLIAGFGVGVVQIAVIDAVRYIFTGTWDGFHFG